MKSLFPYIAVALIIAGCSASTAPELNNPQITQVITTWNELVLQTAETEDGFLTLKGLRTASMMHIAMHDALSSISGKYTPYVFGDQHRDADPLVAVVHAALAVASSQYPDKQNQFEETKNSQLRDIHEGASFASGVQLGEAAARAILDNRKDDGWNGEAEYQWHPMAPGVYAEFNEHSGTPEGFIFGAGWGAAMPFGLSSNNQILVSPPPEINSKAYTDAFIEVKEIGRFESTSRTPDQTHIALWWKDFVENSHNRLARQLVAEEQPGPVEAARLFALLNMSVYDAYVSSFYNKFHYNHWRPYTAIRWADNDSNPDTAPDPDWTNTHQHTYAFPSYPSAHGTACGAAMQVMTDTFGEDYPFTMTTKQVDIAGPFSGKMKTDPPSRSFSSFSEAAMECTLSRVYLGIHFRYDSIEGNILGTRVGDYLVDNHLALREK